MSSIAPPASPDPSHGHQKFTSMLRAIQSRAGEAFPHLGPEDRTDAVREAIGRACCAMSRLAHMGKTDLASPSTLARFGVSQVNRFRHAR